MNKSKPFGIRFPEDILAELRRIADTTGADPSFLVRLAVADAVKRWRETGRVDMAIALPEAPSEAAAPVDTPSRRRLAPKRLNGEQPAGDNAASA